MPSRQNVTEMPSPEVQGDGSWVKFRKLTVKEMKVILGRSDEDLSPLESFVEALRMYIDHVVEWNWVDDDGNPLPQPNQDPAVVDLLTNEEVMFLGQALSGAADSKN